MIERVSAHRASRALLAVVGIGLALEWAPAARGDVVVHAPRGAVWKYFPGLTEASSPDPAAWRLAGFDDSTWASAPAPFGFGDPGLGTDLNTLTPPMRDNYAALFLRRVFEISDPGQVLQLVINADYDDGCLVWINGREVLRVNVAGSPGDPVTIGTFATTAHESGTYETWDLPVPSSYLVPGINVIAVQAFNTSAGNNDFKIDLELLEPFGPDRTPPMLVSLLPPAGATVASLAQVEVTFSEEVRGVDAADLLAGGKPAAAVTGSAKGPYVFAFPQPPAGTVDLRWASGHGITDLSPSGLPFDAGPWSYNLDPRHLTGELVINELLASSVSGRLDEDGDASDWIEVHNPGLAEVSLEGWALTDDAEDKGRWTFPAVTLSPGDYLVVFASGKDRKPLAGNLHASFKLSTNGEYLGLFTPESPRRVSSELAPRYPEQRTGISYGRDDSGLPAYFDSPTPGEANAIAAAYAGIALEPLLSVPHGLYDKPFSLEIASRTAGADIYYTLDGSEPDPQKGLRYAGPILIEGKPERGAITVRAAAFKDGFLSSSVATGSYIFPSFVLAQPSNPAGFPATWGTQPADYRLDPRVIDAPGNRELALQALKSIPSLSIVTDVGSLFDRAKGIYANPAREGLVWERPVSAELIYPDGNPGFQVDCGLRVQGGSSTLDWKSIKVSLRLLFRGDYGARKLNEKLFAASPVESFDTLVLDAHLNLTWTHPGHDQRVRAQYVRDSFVSDLQNAVGSLAPHGFFAHLFLNGLYWGVYDLHERPDADFASSYLGGAEEEYDALKHNSSTVVDGNLTAYNTMLARTRQNLAVEVNYAKLAEYLDIRDLADYMIVNLYAGNDDWAHQNWYAGRRRAPGQGFRYFSWDAEHVLKDVNINQTGLNNPGGPTEVFARLRTSPEFRLLFADRVHRHFFGGGPLYVDPAQSAWDPAHPERNRPAALYMRRIEEVDAPMVLESARWGDARRPGQPYTREGEWQTELNALLAGYFPRRSSVVLGQFRAIGLYPNAGAPAFSLPPGDVAPGAEVAMTLPAGTTGTIHFTTDGSDPRVPWTGTVSPSALEYTAPIPLEDHTVLMARTLSGATWSALNEAAYTMVRPRDALRITEIHYHDPLGSSREFVEVQNISGVTVALGGLRFSEGISFELPAAMALGPKEFLVLVEDPVSFAGAHPGVVPDGVYDGSLSNGGERITIADELGQSILSVAYDDEDLWPLGADGLGFSLVLADPAGDAGDPANWRASAERGGSPGLADPPAPAGSVLISEILARSRAPLEDAIELFNPSTSAIDISGWFLSDSRIDEVSLKKFRIPPGTVLGAGEYRVFYEKDFNSRESPTAFALDGSGDEVFLAAADVQGNLAGHVTGQEFEATEEGVSLGLHATSRGFDFTALLERTFGSDSPADLEEFRRGTGAANAGPRPALAVIHEIHYNPMEGVEFIEIHNPAARDLPLFDPAVERGWQVSGIRNAAGDDDYEFPPGTVVPAGGYLVLVPVEPEDFKSLRDVPPASVVVGPYSGALDNAGEWLKLRKPLQGNDGIAYADVDKVRYGDGDPWPTLADGGGPSLERLQAARYGNEPLNWGESKDAGGTPGAPNTASAGVNHFPAALFSAAPRDGNPLEVLFDASSSLDPDGQIVAWDWEFADGSEGNGKTIAHSYARAGFYTVKLTVTDNGGASSATSVTVAVSIPSAGGRQIPGDGNQDGKLDISDAVALLFHLFGGATLSLPCHGATVGEEGNLTLLDLNADSGVDLSDAIHLVGYLFLGGPPPAAGRVCIEIEGCPDACIQ